MIKQVKCSQLSDHFVQFGDVKEVVVRRKTKQDFAVGIVTFERAGDAKVALAGNHCVLDELRNVSTAIADAALSCIAEYERPFKSTITLTELSIKCLRSIYSWLPITDLCSIADTCSRFRKIRMLTLSLAHKTIEFRSRHTPEFGKIVKKFGNGIKVLDLQFDNTQLEKSLQTLQLATEYCSFVLNSLTLSFFRINESMLPTLRDLFFNLESLKLNGCGFDESISSSLLSECRRLKQLEVVFSYSDYFPAKAFSDCPPLECLKLAFTRAMKNNKIEILKLVGFLKSQKNLRKLTLIISCLDRLDPRILNVLIESCSVHLKSLHLSCFNIDSLMAPKLRILFSKLEELKMDLWLQRETITDIFTDSKHLVKLSCSGAAIHKIINASDLPQLEYLKMIDFLNSSTYDSDKFKKILTKMEKLKTIKLDLSEYNGTSIYEIIAGKNVQEIKLYDLDENSLANCFPLCKLDRITSLKLSYWYEDTDTDTTDLLKFFKNFSPVEHLYHLELINVLVDCDLLKQISKFKNLRHLHLASIAPRSSLDLEPLRTFDKLTKLNIRGNWSISDTVLIKLVTNLKKLTDLTLNVKSFTLGYTVYNEMLNVVHAREQTIIISTGWWEEYEDKTFLFIERDVNNFNT